MQKINVSWDMETADPDDVFTLCLLSHHPMVNLVSVTITPGSKHQVGLVKHVLKRLGKEEVPVGARKPDHPKECVSGFHYKWLGKIAPEESDGLAVDVLDNALLKYDDLVIICGAALSNVASVLDRYTRIPKLVAQGGFAGDNIVPKEYILDKFKGKQTCPTFNLNADVKAGLKVIDSNLIDERWFVSKNVCHGVKYDTDMHSFMRPYYLRNPGLELMYKGMDLYLKKRPGGKAFHDPLAACCAIDPSICEFKEVELYREKGQWGSRISCMLNAKISVSVDMIKFKTTMVGF